MATIDQELFDRLLSINKKLASLYLFDRRDVWASVTEQIRDLYDCELASLFLVDEDDPNHLVLEAQYPPPETPRDQKLRLKIASEPRSGLTGHIANVGETVVFVQADIDDSPYIKDQKPNYLPSKQCYSALFAPLKNRRGKLVGLLRLQNRSHSNQDQQAPFTDADKSGIDFLATEIVTLLENAHAFESLRSLVEEVQGAGSTGEAVDCILPRALKLLNADHAKLALWSQENRRLVFAGSKKIDDSPSPKIGDPIEEKHVMSLLWQAAISDKRVKEPGADDEIWLEFGPYAAGEAERCDPAAKSSISIVLRVHKQPVGVLHIESNQKENFFNDVDRQVLKALAQNISIAVQSMSQPWSMLDDEGNESEKEALSLGQSLGLFQSLLMHIPLVMWRKDKSGKFVWVNDLFCKTVRRKRNDVIGKGDLELFPANLEPKFRAGDEEAMKNGIYEDWEEPYALPSGEIRYIHVIKMPYYDLLGNVAGTQGIFLDNTGDKYRQLFTQAPVGFHALDVEGNILHVNEAERTMLGYSEEEMREKPYWYFSPEHDREVTKKLVEDQLAGRGKEGEWHPVNLRKQDDVTIPVLINCRRASDADGKTNGLLCAVREISAGTDVEAALRDPDTRYLARIKELSIPVFCVGKDLKITFANKEFLKKEGYKSESQVIGKTGPDLYGELGHRYHEDSRRVLATGEVLDQVELHPSGTGKESLVRVLKFPIRDSNGKVIGVQGVFWNSEDQEKATKALTEALAEAKEEYRQIVNQASEGIYQSTLEGDFIAANPAMFRLLGFKSEEELLALKRFGQTRFADPYARIRYLQRVRAANVRTPLEFEYRLRTKDKKELWVAETVQKELDHKGDVRLVGFVEDITERRENAERIKASLKEKEEMLTMLSHQLRSPVWQAYERANHLVHELDPKGLLADGKAEPPVPRLATIRGLARKTRAVAWSIEMMSKLAQTEEVKITEKTRRSISPRNLIKMARETARDVQLLRRLSTKFAERIGYRQEVPEFTVEVTDDMESHYRIQGDLDLIEQCVGNVIENAFKYSIPSSTIKIHCLLEYDSATLTVRNQPFKGLEIDADTRKQCRQKEWRSQGAAASDADGTGLGLWFADRIMIAHEGELRIEETDSEGWNTFALYFPLSRPESGHKS